MTARSPLRLRLGLAVFGVLASTAAAIGLGVTGHAGPAIAFAVIAAAARVNIAVVIIRIRQGRRFQPGRNVPPLSRDGDTYDLRNYP